MALRAGMKEQSSEDPMKSCSFSDESIPVQSENIADSSVFQSTIPLTNELAGSYSFQMELGTQAKRVANPDWVYKNDKLYIKPSNVCPILFSVLPSLTSSCNIRVTPIFKDQAHIRDIVRCCPNHSTIDTFGYSTVPHFIRCDNQKVTYAQCHLTGRYFLTIPFVPIQQEPTTKSLSTHELFSFVCNNSCGGLNRRAIQVIFELIQGQVIIGRKLIEVRVCACPGRDSKFDESEKQPFRRKRRCQSAVQSRYLHSNEPPYQSPPTVDVTPDEDPPAPKKKTGENFYLKINGRHNFVIMERIAKALELFTSMEKRFFSKNFPSQPLDQMSKPHRNEPSEYVEPDSTLYRRNPCQSVNDHSPLPPSSPRWPDTTYSLGSLGNHSNSSSQVSYSDSSTARKASVVN